MAILKNNLEIIKVLLDNGADINYISDESKSKESLLMLSLFKKEHEINKDDIIFYKLLDRGANPDYKILLKPGYYDSPLATAFGVGSLSKAYHLLSVYGVDYDYPIDSEKNTIRDRIISEKYIAYPSKSELIYRDSILMYLECN